jgi:hypothetical protein
LKLPLRGLQANLSLKPMKVVNGIQVAIVVFSRGGQFPPVRVPRSRAVITCPARFEVARLVSTVPTAVVLTIGGRVLADSDPITAQNSYVVSVSQTLGGLQFNLDRALFAASR